MVATLDPDKRRVEQGLALMVVAPTVIWTARVVAIGAIGPGAPEWVWRELPWIGALGFAIGWIVVGGALRPAGSAARGVALALLLYAIAGAFGLGY